MTSKAITSPGCERTEAKGPVGYIAVDGVTARRSQTDPPWPPTASTKSTYLKPPQPPTCLIQHHPSSPWFDQRLHRI